MYDLGMTPHEAEQKLIGAITDYATATGQFPTGCLVNEFTIITQWQSVDYEGEHEYTIFANSDGTPVHHIIGLMRLAAAKLESGG